MSPKARVVTATMPAKKKQPNPTNTNLEQTNNNLEQPQTKRNRNRKKQDTTQPANKKTRITSKLDSFANDVNNFTQEQFEKLISAPLERPNLQPKTIAKYEKNAKVFAEFVENGKKNNEVSQFLFTFTFRTLTSMH